MKNKVFRERLKSESSYLFDLVKSLDKGDKKFFKMFLQRKSNSEIDTLKYSRIFDIVDSFDESDDDQIFEKLEGQEVTSSKSVYKVEKQRTYELILTAMRTNLSLYDDPSVATLKARLLDVQFLIEKNLISQALIELAKIKVAAVEKERFGDAMQILELETKLLLIKPQEKYTQEYYLKRKTEYKTYRNNFEQYFLFLNDCLQIQTRFDESKFLKEETDEDSVAIAEIWKSERYSEHIVPQTLGAKLLQSIAILLLMEREMHVSQTKTTHTNATILSKYKNLLEEIESWKNFESLIPELELHLFNFLDNMIKVARRIGNHEIDFVINKLSKFEFKNDSLKVAKAFILYVSPLGKNYTAGQLMRDRSYVHQIQDFLEHSGDNLTDEHRIRLIYAVGRMLFCTGNFEFAKIWLEKVMVSENSDLNLRKDIKTSTLFLICLVDYELKNYSSLKTDIETCRRYLEKVAGLNGLNERLLKFFFGVVVNKDKLFGKEELIQDLIADRNIKENSLAFTFFNYVLWFQSDSWEDFESKMKANYGKIEGNRTY